MCCRVSSSRGKEHPNRLARFGAPEAGSEQVEFALVVTVLLVLLLGIFWFARAYNVHETMTRAAREGARVAAMPNSFAEGNTFLDGANATKSESAVFATAIAPVLRSANLDPEQVTDFSEQVRWLNPADTNPQCGVAISFAYPFTFHIPFTSLRFSTIQLRAHAQMRRENQSSQGTCP